MHAARQSAQALAACLPASHALCLTVSRAVLAVAQAYSHTNFLGRTCLLIVWRQHVHMLQDTLHSCEL